MNSYEEFRLLLDFEDMIAEEIKSSAVERALTYNPLVDTARDWLKAHSDERKKLSISQLWAFCSRKLDLNEIYPAGNKKKYDQPEHRLSLLIGTSIHHLFQNKVFRDILLGNWSCALCGGFVKNSKYPGPGTECPHDWEYQEVTVRLPEPWNHIEGHTDGIVEINGSRGVLDIKTIQAKYFELLDLNGPDEGYIYQVNLYMLALNLDWAVIFYVNKDRSRMKSFSVRLDMNIIEDVVTRLEKEEDFVTRRKMNQFELAPRICGSLKDKRAFFCPQGDLCFNDKRIAALMRKRK